ncbi:hypothetical protein B566_EDAN008389 [Ephemera danica]|nr:hypothetical protein B566_EDAN008389 [Ephemera danica]
MATADVEESSSLLKLHQFTAELMTVPVFFEALKLKDSLFLWIGSETRTFSDLGIAMPIAPNDVTTTRLLGSVHLQTPSDLMARRLSTKLNKPVYLSYNIKMDDSVLMKTIEKKIHEEIVAKPECF